MKHFNENDRSLHLSTICDFLLKPVILVTIAIGIAAAFGAFDSIFAEKTIFERLIPSITGYANRSMFQSSSRAYFTLMFPLGLLWLYEAARLPRFVFITNNSKLGQAIISGSATRYVWTILSVTILLGAFAFFVLVGCYDFNLMPVNSSRLALATFGPLYSSASFLLLAGCMKIIQFNLNPGEV